MTDKEAADILYSVCGYLGLSAQMLKYRVLSGWVLMPPPRVNLPVYPLGENKATPTEDPAKPPILTTGGTWK